jgi:hypothetical protein
LALEGTVAVGPPTVVVVVVVVVVTPVITLVITPAVLPVVTRPAGTDAVVEVVVVAAARPGELGEDRAAGGLEDAVGELWVVSAAVDTGRGVSEEWVPAAAAATNAMRASDTVSSTHQLGRPRDGLAPSVPNVSFPTPPTGRR